MPRGGRRVGAGRPRDSAEVKDLRGTRRADRERPREADPEALAALPKAPSWLSRIGKVEWKRTGEELVRLGMLRASHLPLFEARCALYAQWREANRKAKVTLVPTASGVAANPMIAVEQRYLLQLRLMDAEFKLTIASQAQSMGKAKKKASPMADILGRRQRLRLVK